MSREPIQFNNHPILQNIVCLAESYRKLERDCDRGKGEATSELHAVRRMLDQHLGEWRKAIDENPSAFVFGDKGQLPEEVSP